MPKVQMHRQHERRKGGKFPRKEFYKLDKRST